MDLFRIHYNDDTQIVICLNTVTAFHQIICLPPLGVTISRTSDPFKAERLDLILQESEPRLPTDQAQTETLRCLVTGPESEIRDGIVTEILQEVVRIHGQELKTKASKSSPNTKF